MDAMVSDCMAQLQEEVSTSNIKKRLGQLFAPRCDGSYLVPKELVEQYKDPKQRPALEAEFKKAGLDKDWFLEFDTHADMHMYTCLHISIYIFACVCVYTPVCNLQIII